MARKAKPERADVCIIGAGASGATAAKVLTERGVRVVALERGPWRKRESFGGDELANVNRYNLWPDPILNPRTVRTSADGEAPRRAVLPGAADGRRRHGPLAGLAAALHAERLPPAHDRRRAARHRRWPTGRSPTTSSSPTTRKVEWAFGVSGQAGANAFEGPRSRGYPARRMPMSRYAQKFHEGCAALGWNSFPTPQAALSRPFNGRPPTVDQRLRPAARRPDRHALERAQRLRPGRLATGRFDLRPDCYVRELTRRLARAGSRARSTRTPTATCSSRRPTSSSSPAAPWRPRGCCCCRRSGRFPNGLANGSDLVGRNVTFHEYSAAVGVFDDPIYAWAGGGYVSASRASSSTSTTTRAAASSAAATSRAPASASRCRSTGACPGGRPGAPRPRRIDRELLQPQHGRRDGAARHAAARQPRRPRRRGRATPGACRSPASR